MKIEHAYILSWIEQYLNSNPGIRFAQALSNLGITEFADPISPEKEKHQLRDIYYDTDEMIIKRLKDTARKQKQS